MLHPVQIRFHLRRELGVHNMLEMHYDNSRTRAMGITSETGGASNKSDEEIIRELFELQNGRQMNEEEINYIRKTICGQ